MVGPVWRVVGPGAVRILGVDPGTKVAGFGLLDLDRYARTLRTLTHGVIIPRGETRFAKLGDLYDQTYALLDDHAPRVLVIESAFVGKWPRAALALSEARGVIIVAAHQLEIEIREYAPTAVKKALTGNGNANKDMVRKATATKLRLDPSSLAFDTSDALAIAITHAPHERAP